MCKIFDILIGFFKRLFRHVMNYFYPPTREREIIELKEIRVVPSEIMQNIYSSKWEPNKISAHPRHLQIIELNEDFTQNESFNPATNLTSIIKPSENIFQQDNNYEEFNQDEGLNVYQDLKLQDNNYEEFNQDENELAINIPEFHYCEASLSDDIEAEYNII